MGERARRWWRWGALGVILLALVVYNGAQRTGTGGASGTQFDNLPPDSPSVPAREHLRLATFNIHGMVGTDGRRDPARTAALLHDFDLVALNEVHGNLGINDTEELRGALPGMSLFAPTERRWWHDDFGNGVLAGRRIAITSWMRIPLRCTQSRGFRNAVLLKAAHNGQAMNVLITHLDRSHDHDEQLRAISALFLSLAEPAVLMGDLNSDATDAQLARLLKTAGVSDAIGAAMKEKTPRHIDWILVRGLRCVNGGLVDNGASDHPLAWAELATIKD